MNCWHEKIHVCWLLLTRVCIFIKDGAVVVALHAYRLVDEMTTTDALLPLAWATSVGQLLLSGRTSLTIYIVVFLLKKKKKKQNKREGTVQLPADGLSPSS